MVTDLWKILLELNFTVSKENKLKNNIHSENTRAKMLTGKKPVKILTRRWNFVMFLFSWNGKDEFSNWQLI